MASDISTGHALAALRPCISRALQLLSGVETEFEATGEVSLQVAGAVEVLSFVESDLLEDVILASYPFLLLKQKVVGAGDLVVLIVLHEGR